MLGKLPGRFSYANVVATLALFIALGGGAYAAGKISGSQIKANSIPGNRIQKKTLTGNQIKPASLTGTQVKGSTLTDVNAASLATVQYVQAVVTVPLGPNGTTGFAACPAGQKVIGGGATVSDPRTAFVNESGPSLPGNGWVATGFVDSGPSAAMTVTVICTPVKTPAG
jgi:hypothetical protein